MEQEKGNVPNFKNKIDTFLKKTLCISLCGCWLFFCVTYNLRQVVNCKYLADSIPTSSEVLRASCVLVLVVNYSSSTIYIFKNLIISSSCETSTHNKNTFYLVSIAKDLFDKHKLWCNVCYVFIR